MKDVKKGLISVCALACVASVSVGVWQLQNANMSAEASTEFTIAMIEGASLRIGENDGQNGLTYTVTMPKADYETLMTNVGEDKKYKAVEFGVLIAPYAYHEYKALNEESNVFGESAFYDWAEWTVGEGGEYSWVYSGSKVRIMNFTADSMYLEEPTDTYYSYAGSIVNILDGDNDNGVNNLANEFYGVGYVKTTLNENDTVNYVFTEDNRNNVSAAYIAQLALADTNSTLTTTEKQWLQDNYIAKAPTSASTTSYKVESYFENASGEYVLDDTQTLVVEDQTVGETVTVTPSTYDGYILNDTKSVLSGQVYYNGKRVFKAYYDIGYENTTAVLVNKAENATYDLTTMLTDEQATFVQGKENVTYKLTNSLGAETYNDANSTVTLSTLANGVYTLEILSGERVLYNATQVDICDSTVFEFLDDTIDFVENFEKTGNNTHLTTLSKATDEELETIGMEKGDVLKLVNTKAVRFARAKFASLKHTDAYYTTYFGTRELQFDFWMTREGDDKHNGLVKTNYLVNTYATGSTYKFYADIDTVYSFSITVNALFSNGQNTCKELLYSYQGSDGHSATVYQGNWRLKKEIYEETELTLLDTYDSGDSVAFTALMTDAGEAHIDGARDVTYTLTYKNTNTKVADYTEDTLDVSDLSGVYVLTVAEGSDTIYSGTVDIFDSTQFEFFDEQVGFANSFVKGNTYTTTHMEATTAEKAELTDYFSGDVLKVDSTSSTSAMTRRYAKFTNLMHTQECYTAYFADNTITYDFYMTAPTASTATYTGSTYGIEKNIIHGAKYKITVTMETLFDKDCQLFRTYNGTENTGANYYGNFRITSLNVGSIVHTDTVEVDNGAVKMQGHRGLSGLYADNTIPGFTAAAQKGYWGIETDVQVTKDGVFVLCHDSNLSEIAGVDMDVAYTNYEDLKAVNLLNREGVPEEGLYIPTLAEYLDICKAYGAYAVIELKATFTDEQCAELVQLVKDKGMFESAMFTSFKQEWLLQVKAVDANATLMLITQVAETLEEKTAWMLENGIHANLGWDLVTEEVIQTFHDAGLLVCSGAGDYYDRFEKLMQFDVDIIGSDIFV